MIQPLTQILPFSVPCRLLSEMFFEKTESRCRYFFAFHLNCTAIHTNQSQYIRTHFFSQTSFVNHTRGHKGYSLEIMEKIKEKQAQSEAEKLSQGWKIRGKHIPNDTTTWLFKVLSWVVKNKQKTQIETFVCAQSWEYKTECSHKKKQQKIWMENLSCSQSKGSTSSWASWLKQFLISVLT